MRKLTSIISLLSILLLLGCGSDEPVEQQNSAIPFESYDNDPLGLRVYTLENGMKVFMSVNKDEPRIQTAIAVRTGSANDPSDATGLAHYLEHMIFKGTSKMASLDWEKEKPLLEEISKLYEEHRATTDPAARERIYAKIDSISQMAAKYVATNEYDQLIRNLGGEGSNAYTFLDQTVYIVNIPSNELQKWLKVEAERFSELVLRIFHTELEAVYEEFNQGQDSDYNKMWHTMCAAMFPTHTYGTQTTIGTAEHLKNPSMVKIHEYFNTYYVPNNMALCISGDFNPDSAIKWVQAEFGELQSKEVPAHKKVEEEPISTPVKKEVTGPMSEWVDIGFRFPGAAYEKEAHLRLLNHVLNNGQAGVLDLNLNQKQVLLEGETYHQVFNDYSMFGLSGYPRMGQTLEEVEAHLLAQLDSVKEGKFDDWLIEACANDMEFGYKSQTSGNWFRVEQMVSTFIAQTDYEESLAIFDKIRAISKDELIAFTKEHFKENYITVYKRQGKDGSIVKVDKPKITPVPVNREQNSKFHGNISALEAGRIQPQFLDFAKDVHQSKLENGLSFYHTANKNNDIFRLFYGLDMGVRNDRLLAIAMDYLTYVGTSEYTPEELQKELFKYGLSFDVFSGSRRTYITMTGLDKNFEKGVELLEHILAECKGDAGTYEQVIAGISKDRRDAMQDKSSILYTGLRNFVRYGENSPVIARPAIKDLFAMREADLLQKVKDLTSYSHYVYYHGSQEPDAIKTLVSKHHKVPETFKDYPELLPQDELTYEKPKVFFTHYDMVQAQIIMISKGPSLNVDFMPYAAIFGEYFGMGFTSIVYQEIRESRALAYSAYARFSVPNRTDRSHYSEAFVGTQNDKMPAALDAMLEILNNMPESESAFESAKDAALKSIESSRITGSSKFWEYQNMKDIGLDHDQRKVTYEAIKSMKFGDFKKFFNEQISGKQYTFLVIGNKKDIDFKALELLGEVETVPVERLYTY